MTHRETRRGSSKPHYLHRTSTIKPIRLPLFKKTSSRPTCPFLRGRSVSSKPATCASDHAATSKMRPLWTERLHQRAKSSIRCGYEDRVQGTTHIKKRDEKMRRDERRGNEKKSREETRKKRGKERRREEERGEKMKGETKHSCVPVRRATERHRQTGTLEVGWIHNLSSALLARSGLAGSWTQFQMSEEPTVSILGLRTRQKPNDIMAKQPKKLQRCTLPRAPSDRCRRKHMSSYMSLPRTRCLQTQPQTSWMCTCRKMVACPYPAPLYPTSLHSSFRHHTPLRCSPHLICPPSHAHATQHHLTIPPSHSIHRTTSAPPPHMRAPLRAKALVLEPLTYQVGMDMWSKIAPCAILDRRFPLQNSRHRLESSARHVQQ